MKNLSLLPKQDFFASPFSQYIFELASQRALFFSHFEARYNLPMPESWGGDEEESPRIWNQGLVAEDKFQVFRTDNFVASFHPGHSSKWSAHELLHNLLGCFFRPEAKDTEFLLGARISEALPVALYYFLDEAYLDKCSRHKSSSSFQSEYCSICESKLSELETANTKLVDEYLLKTADEFMNRESNAIRDSISGEYKELVFHGINLGSDSLLYFGENKKRLQDPLVADLLSSFSARLPIYSDIESFLQVSGELFESIKLQKSPLQQDNIEFEVFKLDLGMRLIQMSRLCRGSEAEERLQALYFGPFKNMKNMEDFSSFVESYREIDDEFEIIEPALFFALGYQLPGGLGFDLGFIKKGILSCFPVFFEEVGSYFSQDVSTEFVNSKSFWSRKPLGLRVLDFIKDRSPEDKEILRFCQLDLFFSLSPKRELSHFVTDLKTKKEESSLSQGVESILLTPSEQKKMGLSQEENVDNYILKRNSIHGEMQFFSLSRQEYDSLMDPNLDFPRDLQEEMLAFGFLTKR